MIDKLLRNKQSCILGILILLLLLTSCGVPTGGRPSSPTFGPSKILTIPPLHGSGLSYLTLFSHLQSLSFSALTVAATPGYASPWIIVASNEQAAVYASHLDGSETHTLTLGSQECLDPSFTSSLRWMACSNDAISNGILLASISNPTLLQIATVRVVKLSIPTGSTISTPSWSPDGTTLAVSDQANCALLLYHSQPPYSSFSLLATLPYPPGSCSIASPLNWWTPDGRSILVRLDSVWYLVSVSAWEAASSGEQAGNGTPFTPEAKFAPFLHAGVLCLTWKPGTDEMTYVVNNFAVHRYEVYNVNIHTQKQHMLFFLGWSATKPLVPAHIAWTPDARHLIFSLEDIDRCIDCNVNYRAEIYSYTPVT